MSAGVVRAKIQQLGQQAKFKEVLRLKKLPPRSQQQQQPEPEEAAAQASTSTAAEAEAATEPEVEGATATPEEAARNWAGEVILKATYRHTSKVYGKVPPLQPGLRGVDIPFNQGYGFQNMEGIIRLMDYRATNGGFVPITTQQKGACLFHAFRKCICCPHEFTNTHLRQMLVSFICSHAEEFYALLVTAISGNYGHIRISQREYDRLKGLQQLTAAQKTQVEEFKEPGPFSIVSYCEALLRPGFYGEELCIILLSMMFKVRISVIDGDSFLAIKVRHTNTPFNADVHLVHVPRCHYIALGMYLFIHFTMYPKLHAVKMHSDASSSIPAMSRSISNVSRSILCI